MGYDENNSTVYRCYNPQTHKIVMSRDVVFIQDEPNQNDETEITFKNNSNSNEIQSSDIPLPETSDSSDENGSSEITPRRSNRSTKGIPPKRFGYNDNFEAISDYYETVNGIYGDFIEDDHIEIISEYFETVNAIMVPKTYQEASLDKYKKEWKAAMADEIKSLKDNETRELLELPPNRKAIGCKWVFAIKHNQIGEVERFKARLVAKGYSQKQGIDFEEVYAPVVKQTTIRIFLSLASKFNLPVFQFDIKTAFLNGTIKETIFMKQPEGYEEKGKVHHVCLLKRSLYGLKQAANSWNEAINETLLTFGFKRSKYDNCLYYKNYTDGSICMILIYVDDLLITGSNQTVIDDISRDISTTFEMRNMGEVKT